MQKALFVDHAFHLKTRSSQFFIDILRERFNLCFLQYDPYTDSYAGLENLKGELFDVIILWQIRVDPQFLNQNFKFLRTFYVPMYDAIADMNGPMYPLFEPYRDFGIICFSKTLYIGLTERGYDAISVQYFPEPEAVSNWGSTDSVFFWQRITNINIRTVVNLLPKFPVKHIHIHKALDPNHSFTKPNIDSKYEYTYSEWFEDKHDMNRILDGAAMYIAPRIMEGIGLSFLGAMARGRCVIAPDVPTMNEYIENGKNGLLYNPNDARPLEAVDIRTIQKNALKSVQDGYINWQKDKTRLLDWLANDLVPSLMAVTVVTHVKNLYESHSEGAFISTLESVRTQRYKKINHVVVLSPSVDNTLSLLKKYESIGWVEIRDVSDAPAGQYQLELPVGKRFSDSDVILDFIKGFDVTGRIKNVADLPAYGTGNLSIQVGQLKERANKFVRYFNLLIKWLDIEIQTGDFSYYFKKHNIHDVAIYGMGKVGKVFYNKIRRCNAANIIYAIDKSVPSYEDLPMYRPGDSFPKCDCIIVTMNSQFDSIKEQLEKDTSIPIVCIDEIVNEIMDRNER